jgi:hypothetical protein
MFLLYVHCKDTIPKIQNKYSQKGNCAVKVPIPTLMFLWAIYLFPQSVCLFCCRKIGGPILGIYRSLTDTWMWKLGLRPHNSFSGNTQIEISLQCNISPHRCPLRRCWAGRRRDDRWPARARTSGHTAAHRAGSPPLVAPPAANNSIIFAIK